MHKKVLISGVILALFGCETIPYNPPQSGNIAYVYPIDYKSMSGYLTVGELDKKGCVKNIGDDLKPVGRDVLLANGSFSIKADADMAIGVSFTVLNYQYRHVSCGALISVKLEKDGKYYLRSSFGAEESDYGCDMELLKDTGNGAFEFIELKRLKENMLTNKLCKKD